MTAGAARASREHPSLERKSNRRVQAAREEVEGFIVSLPGVSRSESARIAAIRWSDEEERGGGGGGGGGGDPVDAPRSRSTRSRRRRQRSALTHPCPFTGAPWNARGVQAPRRGPTTYAESGSFRWTESSSSSSSSWTRYTAAAEVNDRRSPIADHRATRIAGWVSRLARMNDREDGLTKIPLASRAFSRRSACFPLFLAAALSHDASRGSARSNRQWTPSRV